MTFPGSIYDVTTKRLNEQFRLNRHRFPQDFAFQLTSEETKALRSQIATLKKGRGHHRKYRPYAFTEHGALQAANILNSERAVQMSVFVIRAFVKMRRVLLAHVSWRRNSKRWRNNSPADSIRTRSRLLKSCRNS